MKLLRIVVMSFSLSLRRELTFRAHLVFQLLLTIFTITSGFVALKAIYTQTQSLAGWTLDETVILLGTFQLVTGIFATCVEPNLGWFSGQVRDGKLDNVLVQPVPALFLVSLGRYEPFALSQSLLGLLVIGIGIYGRGLLPTTWEVLSWLFLMGAGLIIAWATRVLLASLALWAPSIELDVLYSALWQFGRYPVEIYQLPLRFLLTYILPFAFLATFPTLALTGHAHPLLLLLGLAAVCIGSSLTHFVWKAGLRRYTSATS